MKKKYLSVALATIVVSLLFVVGTVRAHGPSDGDSEREATNEALARALDSIRADNIRADLRFIASDELAGRDTPSPGLRKAARFIRARLQSLKFSPAGTLPEGGGRPSYFHEYRLVRSRLERDSTGATLDFGDTTEELEFGQDYYFSRDGIMASDVQGAVAFAGTAARDELDGIDLSGRWAFVFESDEVSAHDRSGAVRAAGAIGLVVASPLAGRDRHDPERAARYAGYVVGRGGMRVSSGAAEAGGELPIVFVTARIAARLIGAAGDDPSLGSALGVRLTEVRALAGEPSVVELENVCGLWPGSDPELSSEVLIISAHYDHVGVSGEEIYNGADDNGSGTCGLMAIAEALVVHGPMKRSVLLLWLSGEEKGLLGSEAWARSPTLPEGLRGVCDLNIDMIGRNAPDYLLITPTSEHEAYSGLTRMAEKVAPLEGFAKLGSADDYWERSDHVNFAVHMGIPVAFLFSDVHADYHQPTDTIEKIDFDKIERVSRMVVRMIAELQDLELSAL